MPMPATLVSIGIEVSMLRMPRSVFGVSLGIAESCRRRIPAGPGSMVGGSVSVRRANHVSVMRGADAHEIKAAGTPSERAWTSAEIHLPVLTYGFSAFPSCLASRIGVSRVFRGTIAHARTRVSRQSVRRSASAPVPALLFFPLPLPPPPAPPPPARETERAIRALVHLRSLAIAEQQRPCSDLVRHDRDRDTISRDISNEKEKFNSI